VSQSAVKEIERRIKEKPAIMDELPGLVWTRRVKKNVAKGPTPTPGSTPQAFDADGRILRCISILDGPEPTNLFGPPGAYIGAPRIVFYCLPQQTEKDKMEAVMVNVIDLLRGKSIPVAAYGAAAIVSIANRTQFEDDVVIPNAVSAELSLQLDGIRWKG